MTAKYRELPEKLSYPELEQEILKFWKDEGIFDKSIKMREGAKDYTFYEGPPTANGRPGIHHVMARTVKDMVCRYRTMKGFQVHRKAGWDTHGLPVEIEIEKKLGFKTKDEVLKYGIDKFNKECRESVFKYMDVWEEMTERIGYWVDMKHPYITCENDYMESIWWSLKEFFSKDMMYKGSKIIPYCPRCETPLSSHEVSQGYQDVKDPSVYVKAKIKGEDASFLVWTTTPWTLISNVALAVNPKITYAKVSHNGENLILAKERLSALQGEYQILEENTGKFYLGKEYERWFNYLPIPEGTKAWYVVEGDFVTTSDGSGIVHMAPAFGEDDYQTCLKYGIPSLNPVDKSGKFSDDVTDFKGQFVKDADLGIISKLKEKGTLYRKETILHSYPHCWRCKSPLLYYGFPTWYISTTKYSQKMVELNNTINWFPPEVGSGRFGNWLEENKDWAISRNRFWGTPLPIWTDGEYDHVCIGSIEELQKLATKESWAKFTDNGNRLDIHKPYIDEIEIVSPKTGKTLKRANEVIDVWYDSGAMPFAQRHYPFENKELFERSFPSDFIAEGVDQTRGWFYSLHAISTFLFGKVAYKNVISNDLILDKEGKKMSKSVGNTVDPFATVANYGADAVRWYLMITSPPWRPTLYNEEDLKDVQRKFFRALVNTYSFFTMYANIDGFLYNQAPVPLKDRSEMDRWILSRLNSLVKSVDNHLQNYDLTKASREIQDFTVEELSNWYVRRNRRRFWKSEMGTDKIAAFQTLQECLMTVAKLMAPNAPFLSDFLYKALNDPSKLEKFESVHLADFPTADDSVIDLPLEHRMDVAQRVSALTRAMREKANLKVRQPLKRILLPIRDKEERRNIDKVKEIIQDEINVKTIDYVEDDSGIVSKSTKANFKALGSRFGKKMNLVAEAIKNMVLDQINTFERTGSVSLVIEDNTEVFTTTEIEVIRKDMEGWLVETDGKITVALDTELSQELINEGLVRELVSKIQNMRKDSGFEITDRIKIYYSGSDILNQAVNSMKDFILTETLAVEISAADESLQNINDLLINDEKCKLALQKI